MRFLPEYGEEASSAERSEAQGVLTAYLHAIAKDDWEEACSYLSTEGRAQIYKITEQSNLPTRSCGETVHAWAQAAVLPTTDFRDYANPQIISLRDEDGNAFALLHGTDGEDYWENLKLEGEEWRVYTLAPQPFG